MIRVHSNLSIQGKHNTCLNSSGYKDPKMAHMFRETRVFLDENFKHLHTIDTYVFRGTRFQRLGEMPRLI